MRDRAAQSASAAFVVLAGLVGSPACADTGGVECSCADPTVTVAVPADRASAVAGVTLAGAGCASAPIACTQPAGKGCASFAFKGTGAGSCTVDVQFDAGPADFQATFTFVRHACCAGVYAELSSGSTIDVPDPAGDAGVLE